MIPSRVLRVPRETLAAAVSPEPLDVILDGLVTTGTIHGYEERGEEVLVWGDLAAMGVALEAMQMREAELAKDQPVRDAHWVEVRDQRRDYFASCRAYMHTRSYRALPPINRAIWKLHAEGVKLGEICRKLKVTPAKVNTAIRAAREAALLPKTINSIPRGGGPGRPKTGAPPPAGCDWPGCKERGSWRGKCAMHYQRHRRLNVAF